MKYLECNWLYYRNIGLWLMALIYCIAGINHFINPEFYLSILPSWLPTHSFLVQSSGIAEIILSIGILIPFTRKISAWGIIMMLIVFLIGVHIPMVLNFNGWNDTIWWIAMVRLPIQFVLIRWAMVYTK